MELTFPDPKASAGTTRHSEAHRALLELSHGTLTTVHSFLEEQASSLQAILHLRADEGAAVATVGQSLLRVDQVNDTSPLFTEERVEALREYFRRDMATLREYLSKRGITPPPVVVARIMPGPAGAVTTTQARYYPGGEAPPLEALLLAVIQGG